MLDTNISSSSSAHMTKTSLHCLVDAVPEIYQLIFEHPEFSSCVPLGCEDKLTHISQIYKTLETKLNRPLRVLDLGCAQGFFSLSLAKLGAHVHGVDAQAYNIDLCNALAAEHSDLEVKFQKSPIDTIITTLKQDQYDFVLGLGVFHPLVNIVGAPIVQTMISILANATTVGIFEVAFANEPLLRMPEDPRQLLGGYAFIHELARHKTHFPSMDRPLYVASNRHWFLNGHMGTIDTWKQDSHDLAKGSYYGTRRYFFGSSLIIKLFTADDEAFRDINIQEYTNEIAFLSNSPTTMKVPRLFLYGNNQHEMWLVREQIEGELLLHLIRANTPYNAMIILQDVLEQLSYLEAAGLYHDDLRTWNILVGSDGHATVIDYGATTKDKKDRGWPYNIFLSFLIVMKEIISGRIAIPSPIRAASFDPESFPEPYHYIVWKLLERSPDEWSFAFLHDSLRNSRQDDLKIPASTRQSFSLIIELMENACKIHQNSATYWRRSAEQSASTPIVNS